MSTPLRDYLPELAVLVSSASFLLLGLDYNGTLTPIVADPAKALLAPETRETLDVIAALANTMVAIVSGRSLRDVRQLVGLDRLYYVGNHGLEVEGPGVRFLEPTAMRLRRPMSWLASALDHGLAQIPGVRIENKEFTLSVHVREVADADKSQVLRHVQAAVAVAPETFRFARGKEVYEVMPHVDWHKGSAMTLLAHRLGTPNALPIFIGDDRTDEDAFRALPDAITIKVGDPSNTAARYHLTDAASVHEFLLWIANVRQGRSGD